MGRADVRDVIQSHSCARIVAKLAMIVEMT